MRPSYQLLFGNCTEGMSDQEHYAQELRLAELCEPLGFGGIWCVEHHFDTTYSMCPDNLQLLSYLAGRTSTIELVTGGVILPWWTQPLRVAEKVALLDTLAPGRVHLGLGRGLSRMEYADFGLDMGEARERFDEAVAMILDGLETGYVEGSGRFFDQPRARLAPAATAGFRHRLTCIAMSPDSLDVAADLGARMATFVQFAIERHQPLIDGYRERFREKHGRDAPPPVLTEFVFCGADEAEVEAARDFYGRYYIELMRHYELDGGHFAETSGYDSYAKSAETIKRAGHEHAAKMWMEAQTLGTPEQIVEQITARREVIGDYHLNCGMSFGGMPYEMVERSMRLFAEEVIPELDPARHGQPSAA